MGAATLGVFVPFVLVWLAGGTEFSATYTDMAGQVTISSTFRVCLFLFLRCVMHRGTNLFDHDNSGNRIDTFCVFFHS